MKFMKYQNKRGGKVTLSDIKAPKIEWGTAQDAMQAALDLEADVNEVQICLIFYETLNEIFFFLQSFAESSEYSTTCGCKE